MYIYIYNRLDLINTGSQLLWENAGGHRLYVRIRRFVQKCGDTQKDRFNGKDWNEPTSVCLHLMFLKVVK